MRVALDSNILIYLAGGRTAPADELKIEQTREIVDALKSVVQLVAPVQAVGEVFVVLRRSGISLEEVRQVIGDLMAGLESAPSASSTLEAALSLAVDQRLQFWDSLILSAAAESACSLLLSEDMQDGFVSRGVTIVNPLAKKTHPSLARLLDRRV